MCVCKILCVQTCDCFGCCCRSIHVYLAKLSGESFGRTHAFIESVCAGGVGGRRRRRRNDGFEREVRPVLRPSSAANECVPHEFKCQDTQPACTRVYFHKSRVYNFPFIQFGLTPGCVCVRIMRAQEETIRGLGCCCCCCLNHARIVFALK